MRRSEILIWFLGPALGVVFGGPALLAQDCNGNGVDDAVDVDARRMDFGAGTSLRITEMENRFVDFHQLGDFDGDGDADLVVALRADASGIETDVVFVRNAGDGSFEEPERIATGDYASGLAAADFNADGDLDLALSFLFPGELMLLLGEGATTAMTVRPARCWSAKTSSSASSRILRRLSTGMRMTWSVPIPKIPAARTTQ